MAFDMKEYRQRPEVKEKHRRRERESGRRWVWGDKSDEYKAHHVAAVQRSIAKKRAYIAAFKTERGCESCGERDPVVLELDHRDPATKHDSLRLKKCALVQLGWDTIKAELEKCDVLCANCHRRRHHAERGVD